MIKAGIIGATSATAHRLIRLLVHHPDVEVRWVYSSTPLKQRPLACVIPQLIGETDLVVTGDAPDLDDVDVVMIEDAIDLNTVSVAEIDATDELKVVDLSLRSACGEMPGDYVAGLPEWGRKRMVRGARHVGCPSPLVHLLALPLLPLAANLMLVGDIHSTVVMPGHIDPTADPLQAASQAGLLLAQLQSSFASALHTQLLSADSCHAMLVTTRLECNTPADVLKELYNKYFDDHHFTHLVDTPPGIASVAGTNKCLIHLDCQGRQLIVTAALDHHIKGSAGNAVHCLNLLFGLDERVGLLL